MKKICYLLCCFVLRKKTTKYNLRIEVKMENYRRLERTMTTMTENSSVVKRWNAISLFSMITTKMDIEREKICKCVKLLLSISRVSVL